MNVTFSMHCTVEQSDWCTWHCTVSFPIGKEFALLCSKKMPQRTYINGRLFSQQTMLVTQWGMRWYWREPCSDVMCTWLSTSHPRFNLPPLLRDVAAVPVCGQHSQHPCSGSSLNLLGSWNTHTHTHIHTHTHTHTHTYTHRWRWQLVTVTQAHTVNRMVPVQLHDVSHKEIGHVTLMNTLYKYQSSRSGTSLLWA